MPNQDGVPSNAIKLSRSEYERIKRLASTDVIMSAKDQKKKNLKAASAAREKKWPNTLAAQRKAKFDARKAREAQAELEMQKLDQQEEDRRAAERKSAIGRANHLLYEQKDQLKKFRSQQVRRTTPLVVWVCVGVLAAGSECRSLGEYWAKGGAGTQPPGARRQTACAGGHTERITPHRRPRPGAAFVAALISSLPRARRAQRPPRLALTCHLAPSSAAPE